MQSSDSKIEVGSQALHTLAVCKRARLETVAAQGHEGTMVFSHNNNDDDAQCSQG